jgi:hypothetical protein
MRFTAHPLTEGAGYCPTSSRPRLPETRPAAALVSAFCSSARRPYALRARDMHPTSKRNNQDVRRLCLLAAARRT